MKHNYLWFSQSWHNCLKGDWGESIGVSHFVFVMLWKRRFHRLRVIKKKGLVCRPSWGMGGTGAGVLSNFAAFIRAVKSNNRDIMPPCFVNYKRVKRCTKGNDRCHLSPAGSAVWLYHQRGNITFWCLHKRSISISQKCNSFHPSLSPGIDSPKNIQWFSFFFYKKLTKQKKKGKQKSILADLSVHFQHRFLYIFWWKSS